MPKTPSTKLHQLINTLSGAEKRYFKVFAVKTSSAKQNKYVQLFDLIDGQEIYNETTIKMAIYGKLNLENRKFSELKNYLYELILKSLQAYDEKSSIDLKLKSMLANVRVLAKRSLYNDCKEILEKAKKLAYQYEAYLNILEILHWQKKIAYAESNISYLDTSLASLEQEEKQLLHLINDENEYWRVFFQLLIHLKKNAIARTPEQIAVLDNIVNIPLLATDIQPSTHTTQLLYHRIYGIYSSSKRSYTDYYKTNNTLLKLIESRLDLLKKDPSEYISVINNQIFCCAMLEKYTEVPVLLEKLKNVKPASTDDKFKIFVLYYLHKLLLHAESGDFKNGVKLIGDREREKQAFKKQLFDVNYYFLYSYIYFGVGDFDNALYWINQLLDLPKNQVRQDLQSVARVMLLIVHYEMGNTFLLESILRSNYRYLKNRNRLYQFEKRIMAFIRKTSQLITKSDLKQAFVELKEDFEQLAKDPQEGAMLRYFDFMAWLDSKINKQTFAKTIQLKFSKKLIKASDTI